MLKKILVVIAVSCISVGAARSNKPGEIDGYYPTDNALRSMSDWYDMRYLRVDSCAAEDIDLDSIYGTGTLVKAILNGTTNDSIVIVKTRINGQNGYISIPLSSSSSTPKLPSIRYIKKTGTVSKVILFIQKINQ